MPPLRSRIAVGGGRYTRLRLFRWLTITGRSGAMVEDHVHLECATFRRGHYHRKAETCVCQTILAWHDGTGQGEFSDEAWCGFHREAATEGLLDGSQAD